VRGWELLSVALQNQVEHTRSSNRLPIHTHTHIHTYIYIYIYKYIYKRGRGWGILGVAGELPFFGFCQLFLGCKSLSFQFRAFGVGVPHVCVSVLVSPYVRVCLCVFVG